MVGSIAYRVGAPGMAVGRPTAQMIVVPGWTPFEETLVKKPPSWPLLIGTARSWVSVAGELFDVWRSQMITLEPPLETTR